MGRLAFLGYSIVVWVVAGALVSVSMIGFLHPTAGMIISAYALMIVTVIGLVWASWALWIKRLHDMDLSGWYAVGMTLSGIVGNIMSSSVEPGIAVLGVLLTLGAIIAELCCLFVSGTKGLNKFGPPAGSYRLTPTATA
jgi:uncharacterized membrane protein YhaH (DUF805 family)